MEGGIGARYGLLLPMVGLFWETAVVFSEQREEGFLLLVGGWDWFSCDTLPFADFRSTRTVTELGCDVVFDGSVLARTRDGQCCSFVGD